MRSALSFYSGVDKLLKSVTKLQLSLPYSKIDYRYCYRAMHFSAKRGIAIACRLSVRPSVCDVGEL